MVKAHTAKRVPGHTHVDGVDRRFGDIKDRYGDAVAWTIMGETAAGLRGMAAGFPAPRSTPAAARPPMAKPAMMVPKDAARASAT